MVSYMSLGGFNGIFFIIFPIIIRREIAIKLLRGIFIGSNNF